MVHRRPFGTCSQHTIQPVLKGKNNTNNYYGTVGSLMNFQQKII